jgi:hypothetical protein
MRSHVFAALALVGAAAACGKTETKAAPTINMETHRGTADALMTAFAQRDAKLAVSLLPPADMLKAHFDCPGDQLVKEVQQRAERATKDITEVPKGVVMEIAAYDKSGSATKQLRAGDEFQGCKAKSPVTVHDSRIDLRTSQDGKTEFAAETFTFLKFGDEPKWFYLH